jgi:uncharacterized protein (TIGR03382 family)
VPEVPEEEPAEEDEDEDPAGCGCDAGGSGAASLVAMFAAIAGVRRRRAVVA